MLFRSSILRNFGFSYADTPISAVDHGFNNNIILSHPAHWYFTLKERIRRLGVLVLGKAELKRATRKFIRINK